MNLKDADKPLAPEEMIPIRERHAIALRMADCDDETDSSAWYALDVGRLFATIDAKEAENAELRRELATKDALIGQPAPDVQTYSTSSWPPNPCRNGHDKCSNDVLMALPGRYLWICRRCGMEGLDIKHHAELGEYERLRQEKAMAPETPQETTTPKEE